MLLRRLAPFVRDLVFGSALVTLATAASARDFTNPIMPGDWSDPGFIRVGDDYYTCRSSFGWQPGIPIAHSRDLVHWEYIGHAFVTLPKLIPGDTRGGVWGVEMGYNPNTKQFLIYAPLREGELLVFYADRPEGPYTMKSMGSGLGIDPGFFADDDGKLYLILNRGGIHELSRDGLSVVRDLPGLEHTKHRFFEGPDIFKRNGWYYLLYSDGGTLPHEPSTISTLRSHSLEGPWEEDPANPVMFATDSGARFESPAHGTLIDVKPDQWYVTFHAHEPEYFTLGREMLMEPITWTDDGWWRPAGGKIPMNSAPAPELASGGLHLAQSDEFAAPQLGLQWFFTCPPDFKGGAWSLTEKPGALRVHTQPGDLGAVTALPGVFQQRVIDKKFSVETQVTFEASDAREAAGLHFYHDPGMNFWIAATVRDGKKVVSVGKYNLGQRADLWTVPNPAGATVHLKIDVEAERATFAFSADGHAWTKVGESIYFGASGYRLRDGQRGDPDLGWVGRYKERGAPASALAGATPPRPGGNLWTGATFGVFAIRDGAAASRNADFEYVHVTAQP